MARIRRYIVAGLLVWLPIGATIVVFTFVLDLMDRFLLLVPPPYRPEGFLGFRIPGLGVILALIVLVVTGMLVANLLGRRLVGYFEKLLGQIPFVRTVYGAVKHFAELVFSDSNNSFKKVLLIEYPRVGLYSLCFQTSENPPEPESRTGEKIVTVFVPTTPNPTSGVMLFVPYKDIIELDMTVEDALKMVISLGVVVAPWYPLHSSSEVAATKSSP
mgnify:FL=1|jgi:uncharacterized membrane protein|tara:strand:- start:456 stop:1103 length:648 start_codon:yes stop_codon:yes gene_type:complete